MKINDKALELIKFMYVGVGMGRKKWTIFGAVIALLVAGAGFIYSKITDDTYEGMSIIPEQHDDIPLFEGLEPTENLYFINGDRWKDIYDFYLKKLPELGWNNEYLHSALNDTDPENDWEGFDSQWTKEGFDGELHIGASYDKSDEQTHSTYVCLVQKGFEQKGEDVGRLNPFLPN